MGWGVLNSFIPEGSLRPSLISVVFILISLGFDKIPYTYDYYYSYS
jgi:hypothetical protein